MATNEKVIEMSNRLKSIKSSSNPETDHIIAGADDIYDDEKGKKQSQINAETDATLANHETTINGLNTQNYVTVTATDQTTAVTQVLPATGSVDTVYRVGNWDVSQYDVTCYSEYSWNGSAYVHISTKTQIGEVFDISAYKASGGTLATFADLAAALDGGNNVPVGIRRGGMSVKFVQSSDNKYVQYRLIADSWSIDTNDWSFCGDDVLVENPEWIRVYTDSENRILFGIKATGEVEFSLGVPTPVREYVISIINAIMSGGEGTIIDGLNKVFAFLDDYSTSDTLAELLDEKVDKEEGKGLIDNQYVEEVEYDELIKATCDAEGKVLQGIKKDGSPYFPHHEMMKVDEIPGYNHVVLDDENKIVEGINEEGRHVFNAGVEISQLKTESGIESGDWIDVKTDSEGRILEGINKDGKKYISDFDRSTEQLIADIASKRNNVIRIPLLNDTFISPIPCVITGTKGDENASYDFELLLSQEAYNIRFKFRITENLLNQEKSAVIASVNGVQVTATPVPLIQCVAPTSFKYEDEYKDVNWPTTYGGISFNNGSINKKVCKQHLGQEAFSIKYLGTDSATIENTGDAIVLTIGGVATSYSFSTYPTVSELYAAIASNNDFELGHIAMDKRNSDELAVFAPVTLRDTYYCDDKGSYGGNPNCDIQARIDNAPFYLRYAVSNEWHQVEIVKIGNNVYSVCDGNILTYYSAPESSINNHLILGGECGVLFKDVEIFTDSSSDAEVKNGFIISSVNPYIVIFEAHGMYDGPAYTATPAETDLGMSSQNIETMDYVLSDIKRKGYVPVSIKDIAQWCVGNNELPKRCYTLIFDDYRWPVCLNLNLRCVFNRYGAKPALALVTDRDSSITYDGETITKEEAVKICSAAGFDIVSHTHNHRSTYGLKPSQYKEWLQDDIYAAEKIGTDGCVIVFPGGATDEYMGDVMEDVGIKCGIGIPGENPRNNTLRNRFYLSRIDISYYIKENGTIVDYSTILNKLY